jgi:hypothetical protein
MDDRGNWRLAPAFSLMCDDSYVGRLTTNEIAGS